MAADHAAPDRADRADDEIVTATVLFSDVVGSTAAREQLGDTAADAWLRQVEALSAEAVDEHGGTVLKSLGDGILAVFRSASRGTDAAFALHRRALTLPVPTVLRIGIACGDVHLAGGDVHGMPVVIAARLCRRAEPGAVLVSRTIVDVAGSRLRYEPAPDASLALAGMTAPPPAYRLHIPPPPHEAHDHTQAAAAR